MATSPRSFLPAAGHDWALPLYDPLTKLLGADRVRRDLVAQAGLAPGHAVLDIGCGTGTLIVAAKRAHPAVAFTGIDPDPKALHRAGRKASRAVIAVRFERAFADDLPYSDGSFDRVLSSFMLHHLEPETRHRTLREVLRVLRPGGSVHLADLARPHGSRHGGPFLGGRRMRADRHGSIVALLEEAGFAEAAEVSHHTSWFQTVVYYRARRPSTPP
jgi:ubiquinone/menaquinone biosynthesis C-methylase UbiE